VGNRLGPVSTLPGPLARTLDRLADRYPSGCDTLVAFGRRP